MQEKIMIGVLENAFALLFWFVVALALGVRLGESAASSAFAIFLVMSSVSGLVLAVTKDRAMSFANWPPFDQLREKDPEGWLIDVMIAAFGQMAFVLLVGLIVGFFGAFILNLLRPAR